MRTKNEVMVPWVKGIVARDEMRHFIIRTLIGSAGSGHQVSYQDRMAGGKAGLWECKVHPFYHPTRLTGNGKSFGAAPLCGGTLQ